MDFRRVARGYGLREKIAAFRDGFDKLFAAEFFPQPRNISHQGFFVDKNILPNRFEQFVFGNDISGVFNQREQNFKFLRCQRNRFAVAQKAVIYCIQPKSGEIVKAFVHSV